MSSKRIGKFQIMTHNIEDHPEMVQEIMSKVIVVRCEQRYDTDSIHYTAISDHFEDVELGKMIPEYQVIHDGVKVTFHKLSDTHLMTCVVREQNES